MPHTGSVRFVNRSSGVLRFPSPRGNRMALAPGEFTTDKYYERFARLVHTGNPGGKKPLIMEYTDGTPVGVDDLPEEDGVRRPVSTLQAPPLVRRPQIVPPPSGCETACEGACQFPTETSPVVNDDINAGMDKHSAGTEPPLGEHPDAAETPPTPAETMQATEHQLEPGVAPPMPADASAAATAVPTPTAAPLPQINDEITEGKATVQQVMEQFELTDQGILEVDENYVKIRVDDEELYASRLQLGWTTEHLSAMKAHITKLSANV